MTIYISGAISSDLIGAPRKFQQVEEYLKRLFGCQVVNPMKLPHKEGAEWEDYMVVDLEALQKCDTIYMLSCWKDSRGARLEHAFAKYYGKRIIYEQ